MDAHNVAWRATSVTDPLAGIRGPVRAANDEIGRIVKMVDKAIMGAGKWPMNDGLPIMIGNDRRLLILREMQQ